MEQDCVSIIMSIFNESEEELRKSINSILHQTYDNYELIIVNDNPSREINQKVLSEIKNEKVKIYYNETNIGLVKSLNYALSKTTGSYIARMDADDISCRDRIEKQLLFLKNGKFDLVGSWIELINENDDLVGKMAFPISHDCICKSLKHGGCVAHPTWFAKRQVFDELQGYRQIPHCEDYDFLNRALIRGFKLGNVSQYCLKYRIRDNSVSVSNKMQQLILRRYLSKNRNQIDQLSEKDINAYLFSDDYNKKMKSLLNYENIKQGIKNHNILCFFKLVFCSQFYVYLVEKTVPKFFINK